MSFTLNNDGGPPIRYFSRMSGDLSFEQCLAYLPKIADECDRALAEEIIRQGRVCRVRSFGPPKGGKTTALTCAADVLPAPVRVLSVDRDIAERKNVEIRMLPGFKSTGELPRFHTVFTREIDQAGRDFRAGKISGLVLDTVSTLYARFDTIAGVKDSAFGLNITQMSRNRARAGQSAALAAIVGLVYGLLDDALASPLDAPLILGVTEHARSVAKNPDGDKPDFSWKCWVPRIGGNTGEMIFAQVDLQMAMSTDRPPDDPRSYIARITGEAGTGNRYTAAEADAFMAAMRKSSDLARFGKALGAVWGMRKAAWAKRFGLA